LAFSGPLYPWVGLIQRCCDELSFFPMFDSLFFLPRREWSHRFVRPSCEEVGFGSEHLLFFAHIFRIYPPLSSGQPSRPLCTRRFYRVASNPRSPSPSFSLLSESPHYAIPGPASCASFIVEGRRRSFFPPFQRKARSSQFPSFDD